MKASVSPTAVLLALVFPLCGVASGLAQDAIVQKDGQRREGQIVAVKGDAIRIKIGPAETGIPLASVASVTMAAPKAFDDAIGAWQRGDAARTLATLGPLVETFNGLPTPWAERASALLGEVYLSANQVEKATAAFAAFQKLYPNAGSSADVGLARLALASKDYATARAKLVPIVDKAKSTKLPAPGESAVFGQALFLLAQVQESSAENPEALENYLLVGTIFSEDQSVVAKAEERAKALKEKGVIVP